MFRKQSFILIITSLLFAMGGCNQQHEAEHQQIQDLGVEPQHRISTLDTNNSYRIQQDQITQQTNNMSDEQLKSYLYNKYQVPKEWGEFVSGVKTRLDTSDPVIALTLDACGGPNGSAYDAELIYYLRQQNVPATLFVNSRWIDSNYWTFWALDRIPLFEIANHGTEHRPLSINGRSAWGIKGTENVTQMTEEVLLNHRKIEKITGKSPQYFRAGTAFYDEVGVQVANEIGEQVVNFNVLGDAGATFTKEQVRDALLNAKPGSIVLLHMNKPNGETAEGLKLAIPELRNRGFKFVKLSDYNLR